MGCWGGNYSIPKRTYFLQKGHVKFYYEDKLQDPKMYTYANKYTKTYLTPPKTGNLSMNFNFKLFWT